MIESLATLSRVAQTMAGCALAGALVFGYLCAIREDGVPPWSIRPSVQWLLCGVFLFAGLISLAAQSALVTGRDEALLNPNLWRSVVLETRFGATWQLREGLMVLTLVYAVLISGSALNRLVTATLAALATVLGATSGHAAALEPAWPAMFAHGLHVGALALWWGGLIPLMTSLRRSSLPEHRVRVLERFSRMATVTMVLILMTGIYLAVEHVGIWSALFGTQYGHLLLLKLSFVAVVLSIAARIRWHGLRRLRALPMDAAGDVVSRLVFVEFLAACTVLVIASVMSATPPARHEQITWPFAFRIAPNVTWGQPWVSIWVIAGGVVFIGGATLMIVLRKADRWRMTVLTSAALCVSGALLAIPALCVPAFPDTYRSSAVAYNALSIDKGATLFKQHCARCHGEGGLGDGPQAGALPRPPADLSAPHSADHTAGDMFWWLSHGIAKGGMPAFAQVLDEESRWDVINYLRIFSNGYQGRILRPRIAHGQPWLGAPDFDYQTQLGNSGSLRALRGQRNVLLVLFKWPAGEERLRQLAQFARGQTQIAVLAVALDPLTETALNGISLPVVTQGAQEAARSFRLLRRTLNNADTGDKRGDLNHMELLIDRFGYVRARWLPEESGDWSDMTLLADQSKALSAEPEILPPPDEHIH